MKVAIYARVSTREQSCTSQLLALAEYCEKRGWTISERYVDQGIPGAAAPRPQLPALMRAAYLRAFDVVLVWKFDRFARSVSDLLRGLQIFDALGIQFVSVTEAIDTTTPTGKLFFAVIALVAEFERSLIRERVQAGLAAARRKGKRLGRPRVAVDGEAVARLHAGGASWREIAEALGVGQGTLRRAVSSLAKNLPKSAAVTG